MHRKPLLWVAALALAAVLGLSAQASASTVKGTVVHANKRAHTFVVAGRHGRLTVVSSRRVARAGSVVSVSVRRTRAGALRARHLRVRGHRRHASIRGIVTWASAKGFTVASRGASLLVQKSSSDEGAPVGTPVQSNVTIDDQGDLEDDNTQQVGQVPAQIKLEGMVLSTDPTAETITISGDDDQEDAGANMSDNGGDQNNQGDNSNQPAIVVHVPDATKFAVGDKVELIVTGPAADGSFTLVSVDEQEGQNQGEDNQGQTPGADNSGSGDNSGTGSGGDGGSSGSDG
jgi:uncharacterized membrane protein YgcG